MMKGSKNRSITLARIILKNNLSESVTSGQAKGVFIKKSQTSTASAVQITM